MIAEQNWTDRLVKTAVADPHDLLANPDNPKIHPQEQTDATAGSLAHLGWMARIKVNLRTSEQWGAYQNEQVVIDGHNRVMIAMRKNQTAVPVEYYDLTPDEEALFLITYDQIGTMFAHDADIVKKHLDEISDVALNEELLTLLSEMAQDLKIVPRDNEDSNDSASVEIADEYNILVECEDEFEQTELLENLTEEGYKCRALIS
jgi:ParB-like chromosome segregation protein Spo0J